MTRRFARRARALADPTDRTSLENASRTRRERAIELFGIETVGPQWREFLG
jgi:hypothetical protein